MVLTDEERTQAIEISWRIGRLNYRRRNTQLYLKNRTELAKRVSRKIYWETTRRLGKSSELLATFTEHCLERPGWRAGFFAPVKDGLKDYIDPIINKTYADCPPDIFPTYHQSRFMLEFPNKSSITFRASNNQQHRARRGTEWHEVGVDEGRDVDNLGELIESVLMPALFDSAEAYCYISSTPADTRNHPLYFYRQLAEKEGWLIQIPIWDAHRMDPEVYTLQRIQEWKNETLKAPDGADKWAREYECKWVVDKNRLIVPEWSDSFIKETPRTALFQFFDKYFCLDIGSVDKTTGHLFYYDFPRAKFVFEDEIVFEGRQWTTEDLAKSIREKEETQWGKDAKVYRRVADSNNLILLSDLTTLHRLPILPTTKNSLNAMVNQARMVVKNDRVEVNPRCKLLIQTLRDGIWNQSKDEFDKSPVLGHMDAVADFIYGIRNVDESHNPIPVDYNFNPATQLYPTLPVSKSTQAMEHALLSSNPFLRVGRDD